MKPVHVNLPDYPTAKKFQAAWSRFSLRGYCGGKAKEDGSSTVEVEVATEQEEEFICLFLQACTPAPEIELSDSELLEALSE